MTAKTAFRCRFRDSGVYEAVGVADPDKLQTDLTSMCSEFNVSIRPRITVEERNGVRLVGAFIPEADMSVKPVYRKPDGLDGGAFRRVGSADLRCTEGDLQALFADRDGHRYETVALRSSRVEDFDADAISTYRDVLQGRASYPDLADWPDRKLLTARKCLDAEEGQLRATVAGLVLFGSRDALEREMWMSSRVDYIRIVGTEWSASADSMTAQKFWGPLVLTIPKIVNAVLSDLPMTMTFPPDAIRRTEEPLIPRFVVREVVVNALMHRDYRQHSSVQIIRYNDRIEVHNPGRSLKSVDKLGEVGSELRNPLIANVLYQMQFAEAMGSGLHRIHEGLNARGLPGPAYDNSGRNKFVTTLMLPEAPQESGKSQKADGRSRKDGEKSQKTDDKSRKDDALSEGSESQSKGSEFPSKGSKPQSKGSEPQSKGSELLADLPASLSKRLDQLGGRASRDIVESVIVDLCRVRPFSPMEIATALNRKRDYVIANYLSPLTQQGVLRRLYPPGDPRQRYAVEESEGTDD